MNQLPKLIKANPAYASMLTGFGQIDAFIKKVVEDVIANNADPSVYYIKTELDGAFYSLQLYSKERQAIVGFQWDVGALLAECQAKVISVDVENITKHMLNKFGETSLLIGGEVNWIPS